MLSTSEVVSRLEKLKEKVKHMDGETYVYDLIQDIIIEAKR